MSTSTPVRKALISAGRLTHLQRLEAEAIQIMREAVSESDNPAMLYSIGKDSSVMLHLAMKAFFPSKPPFPLVHVDTTFKFNAMYQFRDDTAARLGLDLVVHQNPECVEKGINPFDHGSAVHTDMWKTEGLKQVIDTNKFDLCFGGARRDEEKSRAKERIFSIRTAQHQWDPKRQRPELWQVYNARRSNGETVRVFPISNWTELDVWQYVYLEQIPIVPLYYAAPRPVVDRDGTLIMVDDDRMPLRIGEVPEMKSVRFRTLGCYPLSGAIESDADTLIGIIQEMLLATTSERQGRTHRHRLRWLDGEEEAGGLLLMAHSSDLIAENIEEYLDLAPVQEPVAVHHVRQRRRRQEHAHRTPAVRDASRVRGSPRRARSRLGQGRHAGRRPRLRPAPRRSVGRT